MVQPNAKVTACVVAKHGHGGQCSGLRYNGIHTGWKCKDTGCRSRRVLCPQRHDCNSQLMKQVRKCPSTCGVRSFLATSHSKWDQKCDTGSCEAVTYIESMVNVLSYKLYGFRSVDANHQHGRASILLAAALPHNRSSRQRYVHVGKALNACALQCAVTQLMQGTCTCTAC